MRFAAVANGERILFFMRDLGFHVGTASCVIFGAIHLCLNPIIGLIKEGVFRMSYLIGTNVHVYSDYAGDERRFVVFIQGYRFQDLVEGAISLVVGDLTLYLVDDLAVRLGGLFSLVGRQFFLFMVLHTRLLDSFGRRIFGVIYRANHFNEVIFASRTGNGVHLGA